MDGNPKDCSGCALCCLFTSIPPFTDAEFASLRLDLRAGIERYRAAPWYRDGHACLWLDSGVGTCRNHEHRPAICREFERGGARCLELRGNVPEKFGPGKVMRRHG